MIPPLRQRREDIPALVHHFIGRLSKGLKLTERPVLPPGAIERLMAYDWPGNVRELRNMVERALIESREGMLSFQTLLAQEVPGGLVGTREAGWNRTLLSLDEINAQHIRQALQLAGGKINGRGGAAEILGLNPNTLRSKMNKLRIPYGGKSLAPFSRG
jgi:DNA-binding NtrC family response regulator